MSFISLISEPPHPKLLDGSRSVSRIYAPCKQLASRHHPLPTDLQDLDDEVITVGQEATGACPSTKLTFETRHLVTTPA
jgi:hypothetical protein